MKAADHNSIVSVTPKEGLAGYVNRKSFYWYNDDKDLKRDIFMACSSSFVILTRVKLFVRGGFIRKNKIYVSILSEVMKIESFLNRDM